MTRQIKAGLSNEVGIYQIFDPARTPTEEHRARYYKRFVRTYRCRKMRLSRVPSEAQAA